MNITVESFSESDTEVAREDAKDATVEAAVEICFILLLAFN